MLFLPFRLDLVNECLWRRERTIALRPKVFAVLRYLVEHPGRLVTQEELLNAVWPDASARSWITSCSNACPAAPV